MPRNQMWRDRGVISVSLFYFNPDISKFFEYCLGDLVPPTGKLVFHVRLASQFVSPQIKFFDGDPVTF